MALNPAVKLALTEKWGQPPSRNSWGGLLGWIEDNYPTLYLELWLIDRVGSGIFFGDPAHTISWNIATRAQAGDPIAQELCKALNALSPNHCQTVLDSETGKPLQMVLKLVDG